MKLLRIVKDLYARLTVEGTTEDEAIRSGIWATGINVGDRALQLIKVIILARILSPEAFGLLGIGLVTVAAFRQLSKLGFDEALIHHHDENVDEYLNTVWVMKSIRGAIIVVVAYLLAPYLAGFFSEPRAELLIQVLALSPLILGLQNPAFVYFRKNLNFHKEFVYQIGGRVVDLGVALGFGLVYQSVWALVAGLVAASVTKFVISYILHGYRPSLGFDTEYGKEMFDFGKWLLISSLLIFLYGQGDDAFVGWFFGATALGYYQIAYRMSNAPASEITQVISRVAFPAFSKIQNDMERLREGYFNVVRLSTILGFPMAAGIMAVAPQFVLVFLGEQWRPAIIVMQGLALWGGLRALGANIGPVFKAVGRPDVETKLQALKVLIIAVGIYPASEAFGLIGVVYVIVGNNLITHPLAYYLVLNLIDGSARRLIHLIIYPLIASAVMLGGVVAIDTYVFTQTGIVQFTLLVLSGIAIYGVIMSAMGRFLSYEIPPVRETMHRVI